MIDSQPDERQATSLDEREIARFNAMAEEWWSADGPMMALHQLNPVRVQWLSTQMSQHFQANGNTTRDRSAKSPLTGLSILDIGCGGGILSESLARLGADVTGLEPAQENLAIAKRHATQHQLTIDYRGDSAEETATNGASFDVVCAMEVVEHVTDPGAFIATACSMVKPGGMFFASTLNRTFKSFALAIVGAEYVLRWVPAGTHQWEKFLTPAELEDMINATPLKCFERSGVVYNPLLRSWRTSSNMDVNYMVSARRALKQRRK